ncbi:MAG: hypothetical protein K2O10_01575, partial [Muribaculaceae bacterium]|nr:hypothetical protein [Muribaculaceae bacterium]
APKPAAPAVPKSLYKTHSSEIAAIKERLAAMETMLAELKAALVSLTAAPRKSRRRKTNKA